MQRSLRADFAALRLVAALAGMCLVAAPSGACAALTAVPPWLIFATGAGLLWVSLMEARSRSRGSIISTPLAAGVAAGLLLPASAPLPGGTVITRPTGLAEPGDLFDVLNRLDADPSSLAGKRVSVSGAWTPASNGKAATVSRRIMSCCAADAVAVGFYVKMTKPQQIRSQAWVRITGFVRETLREGEPSFILERSEAKVLEDPHTRC